MPRQSLGRTPRVRPNFSIDPDLMEKLKLEPNMSGLINRLLRSHYQEYDPGLHYPDALIIYLWQKAEAGDERAQEHLEYIESCATDRALDEMAINGVIEASGGAYII